MTRKAQKTFSVSVEKRLYTTGTVEVKAANALAAVNKVENRIISGKLQTTAVKWDEPEYEDCSFSTTGDGRKALPKNKNTLITFEAV